MIIYIINYFNLSIYIYICIKDKKCLYPITCVLNAFLNQSSYCDEIWYRVGQGTQKKSIMIHACSVPRYRIQDTL